MPRMLMPSSHFADARREPFVIATFVFHPVSTDPFSGDLSDASMAFGLRLKNLATRREGAHIGFSERAAAGKFRHYYLIRYLLVSGSALLGAVREFGPQVNFLSATALGALGTAFYIVTLRRAQSV